MREGYTEIILPDLLQFYPNKISMASPKERKKERMHNINTDGSENCFV